MEEQLEQLLDQESRLQFEKFSNEDAWNIGSLIKKKAEERGHSITINITRSGQRLFHFSMPGTSADNDEWVDRKTRTVLRFAHSSFYIGEHLKSIGKTISQKYLVSEEQYAPHGGAFPVILRGTGVIGTVTVSGLPQADDHALVVEVLQEYLKEK